MDNRQKLLDCALVLFSQRGYDGVAVSEVVDAAGVTKPTLYHYFLNKRGILDALLQREFNPMLSDLMKAATYQGDIVLTLENITRVYFEKAKHSRVFYRMQLSMVYSPPESEEHQAIHPFVITQREVLEGIFTQTAEHHGNLSGQHKRYAGGFLGNINETIGLYFEEEIDLNDRAIYQTVHQFMHGIFS